MNWAANFLNGVAAVHGAAYVARIERECRDEVRAQRDLTLARVQRIATANQHLTHVARGEIDMVARFDIPAVDYHGWALKFADPDGTPNYSCWRDPEFLAEYWRDNPELRCAEGKRMNMVVVPGKPAEYVTVAVPKAAAEIVAREPHELKVSLRKAGKQEGLKPEEVSSPSCLPAFLSGTESESMAEVAS